MELKRTTTATVTTTTTTLPPLAIAQDGHLQRKTIPVAAYIYNLHH
jgi:hypothetical protein